MSVESGKDGKILIGATPIADITRWTFNKQAVASRYGSSSTGGYKATVAGIKHGDGDIEFKWDSSTTSPIKEGTSATLLLYTNSSEFFSVPAIIESFQLAVDIDNGEVTAGVAHFNTNGAWTEPTLT